MGIHSTRRACAPWSLLKKSRKTATQTHPNSPKKFNLPQFPAAFLCVSQCVWFSKIAMLGVGRRRSFAHWISAHTRSTRALSTACMYVVGISPFSIKVEFSSRVYCQLSLLACIAVSLLPIRLLLRFFIFCLVFALGEICYGASLASCLVTRGLCRASVCAHGPLIFLSAWAGLG